MSVLCWWEEVIIDGSSPCRLIRWPSWQMDCCALHIWARKHWSLGLMLASEDLMAVKYYFCNYTFTWGYYLERCWHAHFNVAQLLRWEKKRKYFCPSLIIILLCKIKMTGLFFTREMIWDISKRFTESLCVRSYQIYDPRWKLSTTLAAKTQHPITVL